MNMRKHLAGSFFLAVVAIACQKDKEISSPEPQAFSLEVPANFPMPPSHPDNPLTKEGVELGRSLFYDTRLSGNNKISCASCHHQEKGFADGLALSNTGISSATLHRHAPTLINLAWANNGLFWDGGASNLESQAFGPLTNMDEMGQDLIQLEKELEQVPDYVKRFRLVFNDRIKSANVVKALAQFQRTLISGNSRYDQYVRKENGASLSSTELMGMALVKEKCGNCHAGELFTDNSYHNNGLDTDFSNDTLEGIFQGRYRISYNLADLGKFKTPTLRNVMLTAPYMHDGRFKTIEDVLQHYVSGIKASPTTDRQLYQKDGEVGIPFTETQKKAVIAFLGTLTDPTFINNVKFNNPNH